MSDGTVKQVRVDNWGIFFLQRLQQLFLKNEHCDLVLQFSNNEKIRVHRLVLNACTEYFIMLEKQGHVTGDTMQMPPDLLPDVVIPVINFMYTGKLEFRTDNLKRLYSAAQQMNMTVLTKLLDAQNAAITPQIKNVIKRQQPHPITYNLQGRKIAPKQIDPDFPDPLPGRKLPIWKRRSVPTNVPTYYDESPSYGIFESTSKIPSVVVDESPRPTRFEWPEENVEGSSFTSTFDSLSYETKPIVKPVTPTVSKPDVPKVDSRVATFEEVCRTASNLKRVYSTPAPQDETNAKKAKMDLQAVKELVQEHRLRKVLMDTTEENGEEVDDDLAVADLDDDDDMDDEEGEFTLEGSSELSSQENSKHIEPKIEQQQQHHEQTQQLIEQPTQQQEQQQHQQQLLQQRQPYLQQQQKQKRQMIYIEKPPEQTGLFSAPEKQQLPPFLSEASSSPAQSLQQTPVRPSVLPPQKSILKLQGSHEESVPSTPVSVPSKKVRFLLDPKSHEGKENAATTTSTPKIRHTEDCQRPQPKTENYTSVSGAGGHVSSHAKIISEVLKKYPHLVKSNKNIRLKIMQRCGTQVAPVLPTDGDSNKMVKSKVSYVVLKSEVAGKGKSAVVLKHGGHVEPLSELGGQHRPVSGAENTTGPWLCHSCGSNEEPINFETYYLYRRHLQDVHMEKIDARICEHCGHRASKRNLLLYHLYTKHGVPPPRNCQFPKCDQCDYVALSESLLIKHRNNHSNNKEFVCKVCNAAFKSNGALQGHMQTNLHSDPVKKLYECPFCQKPFIRNINLKAHIRSSHKEVIRKLDEEGLDVDVKDHESLQHYVDGEEGHSSDAVGESAEGEDEGELMEVPIINAELPKPGLGTVVLPSGVTVLAEAPSVQTSLVASSEAEALSNVASGIAASLGLTDALTGEQTVILLDSNQEYVLQSTEIIGGEETTTTTERNEEEVPLGTGELQEYIVPDIMPDEQQPQHTQTYTGSLADLAHYQNEGHSTIGHSTITVTPSQTSTAPPPVSVAVSVVGGDEVTMVLTDHDYAPMRDSNGESVMFFIARPAEHTDDQDMKCNVTPPDIKCTMAPPDIKCTMAPPPAPQLPTVENETGPPKLTAEMSNPVPQMTYSNAPILTREPNSRDEEHILSDRLASETIEDTSAITSSPPPSSILPLPHSVEEQVQTAPSLILPLPHGVEEVQTEIQEQLEATEEIVTECEENGQSIESNNEGQPQQENNTRNFTGISIPSVSEENTVPEQDICMIDDSEVSNGSVEVVIPVAHSTPRRQPPVHMEDIMKEWDDFEDDDNSSAVQQADQLAKSTSSDTEPRIFRGPVID